jgi:hypothetical protein
MTNVDLRLLAVAVCLVRIDRLKNPHCEQAKAYRGLHSRCQIEMHSKMWERACSRRGPYVRHKFFDLNEAV